MIKIKVPATTANLGSGFDTFGLALSLYNEFHVKPSDRFIIELEPENQFLSKLENNLFLQVIEYIFKKENKNLPPLYIKQFNKVPVARGLGSSATAIVGGILTAYKILEKKLTDEDFFQIAYKFESHPDNLLPAWKGNFIVALKDTEKTYYQQLDFPKDIKTVVLIPEIKLSTEEARKVLPETVPFEDAVSNIQKASLFVCAVVNRRYDLFKVAMEDKLHQPYRKTLIPCFDKILSSAYEEGALGVALSGAGTSIVALAKENFEKIGNSMLNALEKCKINGEFKILDIDKKGAIIQEV